MKVKNIAINNDKINSNITKNVEIKYSFPKINEFIKLFNSVGWERTVKRVKENKNSTVFVVGLYIDKCIVGMGRVVGDGSYFTIYDIVVHKDYQGFGLGGIIMKEIVEWYKTIEDYDNFLYVNARKNKENFYEKFGFVARPNDDVGAGMKWYGEKNDIK